MRADMMEFFISVVVEVIPANLVDFQFYFFLRPAPLREMCREINDDHELY